MSESLQAMSFNPYTENDLYEIMFAGWSKTHANHNMGPLIHPYYLIHYVIAGQGHFYTRGRHHVLTAGDSFIIQPGELIQYTADSEHPWEYCWVAFQGERFPSLLKQINVTPMQPIIRDEPNRRVHTLIRRIERTLAAREPNVAMLADGYLQLLLGEYASDRLIETASTGKHTSAVDSHIEHAIGLLTHRYFQPISIAELAHEIGYHRTYFSKMFKERTGMSPQTFLMKVRLEQARILLKSDLTIEQIAGSVGFHDPLYFSKQFKRWYGIPPSQAR